MLGKLFKYEFKSTAKIMLTIYTVLTAVTLLDSIVLSTNMIQGENSAVSNILAFSLMLLYILSAFALFIITFAYMCTNFYKTMFSDQGYLTHTLPVNPVATLNVKLITSFVWMLLSLILLVLSILLLFTGITRGQIWTELSRLDWSYYLKELDALNLYGVIALTILQILLSCLSYLLLVFTSACIGQLFSQYKVAAAIIAGIAIYFVQKIANTVIMLISSYQIFYPAETTNTSESVEHTISWMISLINYGIIGTLVFIIICYIVCARIVKKHINLD